ncbi:MAG: glycosyltransferase family 4 protein [Rhodothermales bacterium]|nr:glycosyltransferase family 4 protein [Rhodothermales bacterium]
MRILMANDYSTGYGGAEDQLLALRNHLRERGHEVLTFSSDARPGPGPTRADVTCLGTTTGARTLLQTANPSAARGLRRLLASFRPDIVHLFVFLTQLSPLILPVLRRIPTLYYAVWYRAVCPLGTKMLPDGSPCAVPWGVACLRNRCVPPWDWVPLMAQMGMVHRWKGPLGVVANSEETRRQLERGGVGVLAVIGHGVRAAPEPSVRAERPTIAFAGRIVAEKGLDTLVHALARVAEVLPGVHLLVAGDGPERGAAERLVSELGLTGHVTFLGHREPPDLDRLLVPAWVHAVPSRWQEPFGMVAAEAMMRAAPVVASRCGGLQGLVLDGETGLLVAPDDAAALADALLALLCDAERAEAMGRAGQRVAEARYTVQAQADAFLAVYRQLLD